MGWGSEKLGGNGRMHSPTPSLFTAARQDLDGAPMEVIPLVHQMVYCIDK